VVLPESCSYVLDFAGYVSSPLRWGFAQEVVSRVKEFCFVAERRMNLARAFKAGIEEEDLVTSRQRRVSLVPAVADATMFGCAGETPALKGRAKFKPPLRGEG